MKYFFLVIGLVVIISGCITPEEKNNFEDLCRKDGNQWMDMKEMVNGNFISESCFGCMSEDGMNHFCKMEDYAEYMKDHMKQDFGMMNHMMVHEPIKAHAGTNNEVEVGMYKVERFEPPTDLPRIGFKITQMESGNPISSLDIVHEKIMHLIVVSKNLNYFEHIHPEEGSGSFVVSHLYPSSSEYKMWIDFTIDGQQYLVDFQDKLGDYKIPSSVEDKLYGLIVGFEKPKEIKLGKTYELQFKVSDSQGQSKITEKFLAATAHLIDIDETLEVFAHNHDENFDRDDTISFQHIFTKKGNHRLWVQFLKDQKERIAVFDVLVV